MEMSSVSNGWVSTANVFNTLAPIACSTYAQWDNDWPAGMHQLTCSGQTLEYTQIGHKLDIPSTTKSI